MTRVPLVVRAELTRRRHAAEQVLGHEVSESQFLADVLATLIGRTDLNGEVEADVLAPFFNSTYTAEGDVAGEDGEGVLQLTA